MIQRTPFYEAFWQMKRQTCTHTFSKVCLSSNVDKGGNSYGNALPFASISLAYYIDSWRLGVLEWSQSAKRPTKDPNLKYYASLLMGGSTRNKGPCEWSHWATGQLFRSNSLCAHSSCWHVTIDYHTIRRTTNWLTIKVTITAWKSEIVEEVDYQVSTVYTQFRMRRDLKLRQPKTVVEIQTLVV